MAEIVNLNRWKKRMAGTRNAAEAKENRVRFGRTAMQKENDRRTEAARAALLDGKCRDDRPPEL